MSIWVVWQWAGAGEPTDLIKKVLSLMKKVKPFWGGHPALSLSELPEEEITP